MKKLIILILSMCVLFSCVKKEQKKSEESQIVDLLNENKSDEALDRINKAIEANPTDELYYLKASSLSMKAGVDIYALFPLLKLKVFDVAISQWSQNREFQKKSDSQRMNIGVDAEDIERQKTDMKKDTQLADPAKIKYEATVKYFSSLTTYTGPYYDQDAIGAKCSLAVESIMITKRKVYPQWITVYFKDESQCAEIKKINIENGATLKSTDIFFAQADLKIRKMWADMTNWDLRERKKKIDQKNNYVKVLGTFWTFIDLIPMAKKIPKVNVEGFKSLEEAQEILIKIRERRTALGKKDELSDKARKQLMMISTLKIVAHLQNSFDMDQVKSPIDFICKSNAEAGEELVSASKDAFFLLNSIEDQEIINKNQDLFKDVKNKYEEILTEKIENPELRAATVKELNDSLEKARENNCQEDKADKVEEADDKDPASDLDVLKEEISE